VEVAATTPPIALAFSGGGIRAGSVASGILCYVEGAGLADRVVGVPLSMEPCPVHDPEAVVDLVAPNRVRHFYIEPVPLGFSPRARGCWFRVAFVCRSNRPAPSPPPPSSCRACVLVRLGARARTRGWHHLNGVF
jgi:hypothetical protein